MADSFVPHDRLPALLAALRAGAEDRELYGARAQRRLLTTALRTSMRSGHLLGRAPAAAASAAPSKPTPGEASTSSGAGSSKAPDAPGASAPAGGYDPSKLPKLDLKKVAGVLVADAPRTMYTVQVGGLCVAPGAWRHLQGGLVSEGPVCVPCGMRSCKRGRAVVAWPPCINPRSTDTLVCALMNAPGVPNAEGGW